MKAVTYQIRLLEPTLVSDLAGDPNSAVAFDYIPGSVLRGLFIGQYLKEHIGIDPVIDDEPRRWFFNGETRWLNAYPLDRLGARSLPIPRSLHSIKGEDEDEIYDLAVYEQSEQWTSKKSPFGRIDGKTVRLVDPSRQISVHTARTRRYGRAKAKNENLRDNKDDTRGAIYRYDALAEGEVFASVVLCPDADADRIKELIDEASTKFLKIGKSQTGGYGQIAIEHVSHPDENWQEHPWPDFLTQTELNTIPSLYSGDLILTLLSDALLRDEATGQFSVEAKTMCTQLAKKLGGEMQCRRVFLGGNILGGFNRKWGLPLPQIQAISSGSVFVFSVSDVNPHKVIDLLEKGIGERRAEGFGRVGVQWQSESRLKIDASGKRVKPTDVLLGGNVEEETLAARVAGRILRRRLEQRVTVAGLKFNIDNPPHKSQLARLRGLVQDELMKPEPNLQRVKDFVAALKERSTTRRQFSQARVSTKPLDEWLLERLGKTDDAEWRGILGLDAMKSRVSIGGVSVEPTEALKHETLLRSLAVFLARAAKQCGKE